MNIEDRHLIDRYLQEDISGIELESFLQRLKNDEAWARQVEFHRTIYSGIRKANQDKLKEIVISSIAYRKPVVPFALKMIVTFLVVTVTGISLWFYVGNETANKDQSNSWFAFLKSKSKDELVKGNEEKVKSSAKQKVSSPIDTVSVSKDPEKSSIDTIVSDEQKEISATDSMPVTNDDDNIIVKQDQLLISTAINIENKTEETKETDESLSKDAVEHLNPGADLPEKDNPATSLIVEFWVSPINYRGYKMSKNKLVLFGIDEPDAVKLYRVNDGIYMSYLKEFYKLIDTFDFVSYQKLKDAEIPLAIK